MSDETFVRRLSEQLDNVASLLRKASELDMMRERGLSELLGESASTVAHIAESLHMEVRP